MWDEEGVLAAMPTDIATLTPDALLDLPRPADGKHYELADGVLITVRKQGLFPS